MRQLRNVDELRSPVRGRAGAGTPPPLHTVSEVDTLQAVLSDIDGTLIATNDLHTAAWCDAFRAHGYPVAPQVIAPMIGMGADKIVALVAKWLNAEEGLGKAIAEDHKRRFLNGYLKQAQPTPGARDLLLAFRRAGVRVYVATSARSDERDALLDQAQIADLLEPPPPSTRNSKPDPDAVVAALTAARVDPRFACMLGDTPYDIDAAARVGVAAVAVRCGGWDDRALSAAAAIYDDPADILQHLDDWALPPTGIAKS